MLDDLIGDLIDDPEKTPPLAAWAGIECTVNRVGDGYYDQSVRTGHHDRLADLDRVASLGFTRLRYPVIWERIAPGELADADWSWTDARLARLRELGLPPIATLVHHGSGPRSTSLVDPAFPARLARYARAVAERYPWLDAYTPINEPLTTARFSGLYGHWYPHGNDEATFLRCLLTQCKATVLGMRAIRAVSPAARLIQTEDLGYTHATPRLAYQAKYENARRWLSMDLLCGRVDRTHELWKRLLAAGIAERDVLWFRDNPQPPDVMGFNYYVTSERYLDEDLAGWPAWSHGSNGRHAYADIHSSLAGKRAGVERLLTEAYQRFGIPLAITEAHIGGTREEQLRWIVEIYDGVAAARDAGVPVLAMTAWSVFGAYDWHCLVTRCENVYEPGLYDVRGQVPRPTALAAAWRAIARGRRPVHPVLANRGWWARASPTTEAAEAAA
jgi:dTDP-4-dehydrorhamnose reductase